jgi:CBS domain-containing protein
MTIRELLRDKSGCIHSVSPRATVLAALELMAEKNIGAVLVTDDHGQLVGILSERDYARKVVLKGQTSRDTPVEAIMTRNVLRIAADRSVQDCMALMTTAHVRHVPVMDGERLVGVVSIGDVVKAIIAEQGFVIEQLERYIWGGR